MNMVLHEWKATRKSTFFWGLFLAVLLVSMLLEFSAYYENPEMLAIIETIPPALKEAFGMARADLTTVTGYVGVTVIFLQIMLGIHGALSGSGILSKEERDKTAEFLMTLPVRRERVLVMKFFAVLGNALLLNLFTGAFLVAGTAGYRREPDFYRFLLLVLVGTFLLQLFFLSLGMFLAAAIRRYKRSGGMAVGLLFFLYMLSVFTELSSALEWLKHVTPFKFFEAVTLQTELSLAPLPLGLILAYILLLLLGTYRIYPKRDLRL